MPKAKTASAQEQPKEKPKACVKYNCPLKHEWPVDPVLAPDGKIYDRRMLLAEVYKNGGFFYGKLFHIGLLRACPERLEAMKNLPRTVDKTVWEKNLAAHRKRSGIVQPAKNKKSTSTLTTLQEEIDFFLKKGHTAEARELFTLERSKIEVCKEKEYLLVILSAKIYIAAEKYDGAIIEYMKILEKWQLNTFYEIAELYALQGDHSESVKWHKLGFKAPKVHHKRENCEKLAEAYKLGRGVEKDEEISLYWTQQAAARSTKEGEGKPFIDLAEACVDKSEFADAVKNYNSAMKLCDVEGMLVMSKVDEMLTSHREETKRQRIA